MHTDISCVAPGSRPGGGGVLGGLRVWGLFGPGYVITMTDDRIERRAAGLLPEERAAGSADPEAQAEALLAESDRREEAPEAVERRRSEQTVPPAETTR